MQRVNATRLVDVFLWECHYIANRPLCSTTNAMLRRSSIRFVDVDPYKKLMALKSKRGGNQAHKGL